MIKVIVKFYERIGGNIVSIDVSGHANSGPYGNDLVCAAVSAVMVGAANALKDNEYEFGPASQYDIASLTNVVVEEGHVFLEKKTYKVKNDHVDSVFYTTLTMLNTIKETNPQFVEIIEKIVEKK